MRQYHLFEKLVDAGIVVSLNGSAINVKPSKAVTPEVAQFIRDHRAELVDMLKRSRQLPPCTQCQEPQIAVATFDGYENFECFRCDCCSGCRKDSKAQAISGKPPEF
jgi:flavoprotein